jgi:hypothetical protein
MTTGWTSEESEFEYRQSQKFSFLHVVQTSSGDHPASYPMDVGGGVLFPRVKLQGREADHSPPTSAEVQKTWIYISTPPIRLHGVVFN